MYICTQWMHKTSFIQERHAARYREGQLNIQLNSNGIDCLTLFGSVERCVCE